jgi:hypothetical protein
MWVIALLLSAAHRRPQHQCNACSQRDEHGAVCFSTHAAASYGDPLRPLPAGTPAADLIAMATEPATLQLATPAAVGRPCSQHGRHVSPHRTLSDGSKLAVHEAILDYHPTRFLATHASHARVARASPHGPRSSQHLSAPGRRL